MSEELQMSKTKLTLTNVAQLAPNRWVTTMSGQDLLDCWRAGIITYNPDIQRGERLVRNRNGEEVIKPFYSPSNVRKIAEKMAHESFRTDTIVLNVTHDGNEKISYENGTLNIAEGTINILDGQHRLRALDMVEGWAHRRINPVKVDLSQMTFIVQIENLDILEAQKTFYQYSLGLKVSRTRAEYFNNTDRANRIARKILTESDMRDKIEIVRGNIDKKNPHRLVTFGTLVHAISMSFPNIETEEMENQVAKFLCEYFNELIKLIPELHDPEKRFASREKSFIADNFAFYGYVAVASVLFGQDDWKQRMKKLLEMDYHKESKLWYGKITRKGRKGGLTIVNSSDSKKQFVKMFKSQFEKLIAAS